MLLRTSLLTSALALELDYPDSRPLDLEDPPPGLHLEILPGIHLGIFPGIHLEVLHGIHHEILPGIHLGIHPGTHSPLVLKLLPPASCLAMSD